MKIRHLITLAGTAILGLQLAAQTPASLTNDWQRVMALSPHTRIKIRADHNHASCYVVTVDADKLTCSSSTDSGTKLKTFMQPEVRSIKLSRRGHSALGGMLIGLGVGGGAGVGILEGIKNSRNPGGCFCTNAQVVGVGLGAGGVVGGAVGALIGYSQDTFAGPTVYLRRP